MDKQKAKEVIRYVEREDVEKLISADGYVIGNALDDVEVHFSKRGDLEEDESKLQVIPYAVLKYGNRILVYKRSGTEQRLLGQLSIGFGGHSNKKDKTVMDTALREIEEETSMKLQPGNFKQIGYIFSNATPVSRVHIGYLYVYELTYKNITQLKVSDEIELAFLMDESEVTSGHITKWTNLQLEDWSQIAAKAIKAW